MIKRSDDCSNISIATPAALANTNCPRTAQTAAKDDATTAAVEQGTWRSRNITQEPGPSQPRIKRSHTTTAEHTVSMYTYCICNYKTRMVELCAM